jgi:effector-binding domain-containing protein
VEFFHRQIIANFTEGNIPSVYTEGITVKKKEIKTRPKGTMMCIYTNEITGIINTVSKIIGKLFTFSWHYSLC